MGVRIAPAPSNSVNSAHQQPQRSRLHVNVSQSPSAVVTPLAQRGAVPAAQAATVHARNDSGGAHAPSIVVVAPMVIGADSNGSNANAAASVGGRDQFGDPLELPNSVPGNAAPAAAAAGRSDRDASGQLELRQLEQQSPLPLREHKQTPRSAQSEEGALQPLAIVP